ncbi:WhiB family transcriptional regulator [Saccharopolyspora erythraea]|uniref:WhiB family transcriptional regulator n=1 Tax=Saccharopolyspora erythraea TaxID=1836 RepID=UPI001BA77351|nr:WhiB family transcriptional regulator [Saccharopolyspora erythraea]QUH00654.1 WhiB family transcriptional regulator [Saccharopolyspora erythraea]
MTTTARLPKPVTDSWQWQLKAACRDLASSRFFHPDHERGNSRDERERNAKKVCHTCPVIRECRAHALATREPYGVWGGLSEHERRTLVSSGNVA